MAPILEKVHSAVNSLNPFKHKDSSHPSKSTSEAKKDEAAPASSDGAALTLSEKPVFGKEEAMVVFVLGGPGSGKGTQCTKLVEDLEFVHLSAGDLLRAEQSREGSPHAEMINTYIKEGKVVPMEVTIKLLENSMRDAIEGRSVATSEHPEGETFKIGGQKKFLIDGFPRKMDQATKFEQAVCVASSVLFLVCPEDILKQRLLKRGETSGRADDNEESIKKRFTTFIETSMPVVDYYRTQDKVIEIDSSSSIDEVYQQLKPQIEKLL